MHRARFHLTRLPCASCRFTLPAGYLADSYDADIRHPQFEPEGWRRKIEGFPCYDPAKVGGVVPCGAVPGVEKKRPQPRPLPRSRAPLGRRAGGRPLACSIARVWGDAGCALHVPASAPAGLPPHATRLRSLAPSPSPPPGPQDLVVPALKTPEHFGASPLAGAATRERTWLGFHRGRVQPENMQFARGIRQRLAKLAEEQGWAKRHRIVVGE